MAWLYAPILGAVNVPGALLSVALGYTLGVIYRRWRVRRRYRDFEL